MIVTFAGSCPAQQPDRKLDLLKNGSFEKGLEGWETTAHRKNGKFEIDKVELYIGQPTLKIDNLGADDCLRGGFERSDNVMKNRAWGRLTLEFETGPKTEVEVGPRLGFFSSVVTGTAWFADLSLVELGPARR